MMSQAYWGRMEQDVEAYVTGLFGGHVDVNMSQNTVDYQLPQGGVGGAVGGPIRVLSLRLIPVEQDPTGPSLLGMDVTASLVPIMDPSQRMVLGTTVSGQSTSRLVAAGQLALDIIPYTIEFHIASVEARGLSVAGTADRFAAGVTPVVRTLENEPVDAAVVRGALTHSGPPPSQTLPPLPAEHSLTGTGWVGRTEDEIRASCGMYEGRFYHDMLIDETGSLRWDLLPADMQERLRVYQGFRRPDGFLFKPSDVEAYMSGEYGDRGGRVVGPGGGVVPPAEKSFDLEDSLARLRLRPSNLRLARRIYLITPR